MPRWSFSGTRLILTILLVLANVGCAGIKVETGRTADEEVAASETQASDMRRNFAQAFDAANEINRALLLKQHIDTVCSRLVSIGQQFAGEWRNGNQGRGQEIPADEMRQVIDNSITRDKPILKAWEDNLEYGWEYVRDSSRFDDQVIRVFDSMVQQYYSTYSAVFFPDSDVVEYSGGLDRVDIEMKNLSRDLDLALGRYR